MANKTKRLSQYSTDLFLCDHRPPSLVSNMDLVSATFKCQLAQPKPPFVQETQPCTSTALPPKHNFVCWDFGIAHKRSKESDSVGMAGIKDV